jgi:addiction module RelE/StbE family toxin
MNLVFNARFRKKFDKLRPGEKKRCKERLKLFVEDPFDPMLNNHPLQGAYKGYRSINIGGDLRAVYRLLSEDSAYFVGLGTHSDLYSS